MRDNSDAYRDIFLNDIPLMDARAPVEFAKGAFPGVLNIALMNDVERQKVGTCYKQQGQQAALALGHQLVAGEIKAQRLQAWMAFAKANPGGFLYCFRGGLRSQIVQQWLKEAGVEYPRIVGGYKALRTFLLDTIDTAVQECEIVVVGGMTGTGKTDLLAQLPNQLDLEGHANHRGSSFGKRVTGQPSQIDFENRVAIDLLKKRASGIQQFIIEDESRLIGSCNLPHSLHQRMQGCPLVWLEDPLEHRIERILRDYVVDLCADFVAVHGQELGFGLYAERLQQSLDHIYKRLGGERHARLQAIMQSALDEQQRSSAVDLHRGWIEGLLSEYYDPMYEHQRESKAQRIEFAGDHAAVIAFLTDRQGSL